MRTVVDPCGRTITLALQPQRIISLVPSQTELLHHLGLGDRVVGITKFCVHPQEWHRTKTRVGGTKKLNREVIKSLQPDLIIANREENLEEDVLWLERFVPTWVSDVRTLCDALELVERIAEITDASHRGAELPAALKPLCALQERSRKIKVAYLIWQEPFMAVGSETFVHHMLEAAGFDNAVPFARYPQVSLPQLEDWGAEVIMLSSEPFPFSAAHAAVLRERLPAHQKVVLVDGELCSWYGPRMLKGIPYLQRLYQALAI
jgi:hypothetical protein